jgi:phage tail-like protein
MAITTPHPNHRFRVEIDGVANLDYTEVILPEASADIIEHREGSSTVSLKVPGLNKLTNITLKRGVTGSNDFFNWWKSIANGVIDRRNMSIALLDQHNNVVKSWNIYNAWPARYAVSPLVANDGGTLVIETLECAVDRFEPTS